MRQHAQQVIEQIKKGKEGHEVIPTGFTKLDKHLDGGFYSKELIIIGAHTGVGKSQVAGQIFMTVAAEGFNSAYFSLEISSEMILSRLVGAMSNIKPTRVRYGNLTKEEYEQKSSAEAELVALDNLISFYDDCYQIEHIVSEVKKHKYEFIVIDFIQNVMSKMSDEYARMSMVALTLQKLAKETGACILVLSQLSNTAAKEGSKAKNIEYKGSGSIAMVADLGFFLERPDSLDDHYDPKSGTELVLRKNRRGLSGLILKLGFNTPGGMLYEK